MWLYKVYKDLLLIIFPETDLLIDAFISTLVNFMKIKAILSHLCNFVFVFYRNVLVNFIKF